MRIEAKPGGTVPVICGMRATAVFCVLAFHVLAASGSGMVRYATPNGGAAALCACIEAAVRPGDACLLHAGLYEVGTTTCALNGARGTASEPIVIGAAGDGPVVLDGTIAIDGPWERVKAAAGVAAPHAVGRLEPGRGGSEPARGMGCTRC